MKNKLRLLAMIPIGIFAFTAILQANNAVRVVSDLTGITVNMGVSHKNNGDQVSLSVPAIALNSVTLNGHEYQTVSLPEGDHVFAAELAEEGKPDLPVLTTMLAIPDQAGIQLDVSFSGYDSIENIDIAPTQPSARDYPSTDPIPFTISQETYNTDAFYPGNLATADDPVIMRDVRGVQISINPVQYNPVRKELRIYRDLAISVSYGGVPVNPKTTRTPYLSEGFYPMYKSMFANFDQMFSGAEVKRGGYVIIARPTLVDSLKALALWKHEKGYTTRIVPTTEINSNGTPTSAQIYNYLVTAYHTWQVPPEYLMIVGDVDGAYSVADWIYSGQYASDQHYSQLDGNDILPDIFVARLSISTMLEFRVAVSKIFKYEKTPYMTDAQHWIRGFACGYNAWPAMRYTTLWAREQALHGGFAQVDTVYGSSPDPRVDQIMRTGPGMIWYRGEGNDQYWWGIEYHRTDLLNLPNNQKLGVMTPLTCGLGDFGVGTCFGETWIRMGLNPDSLKGGPAFYGVSDHFTETRWNNPIMVGYFWGIFGSNIYHFAAAAVAGKLQEYRTFPHDIGGHVTLYFNTYNMQGDPELELRTAIPILINVTHPDTIALGLNHIEINVIDTAGHAVSNAYVTLMKMADTTEEMYSLGNTDSQGNLELAFNALTPGAMTLTVSGQNLYPYQGNIQLVNSNLAVGYGDSLFIDDDTLGYSHGNGDSLANPGEALELYVALKNFGDSLTASNITTNLTSLSPNLVEVDAGAGSYGSLGPGQIGVDSHPYVVCISPDAQDGDIVQLKLATTDQSGDSFFSVIQIPIEAPKFQITHLTIQDQNNRVDPGDTVNMVLNIVNNGHDGARAVSATIASDDDYTTILDAHANFGDMPVGDTASSGTDSLIFTVDTGAFAGRRINFTLNTTTSLGAKASIPFSVPVDSVVVATDPTGPDGYGYYMYDKNDIGYSEHPTYNWIEIVPGLGGQGTRLSFPNTDDYSVLTTLPFPFTYYGNSYGTLIVSTNGFVSPDTFRMDSGGHYWADFYNWPIPDPGNARAQISPFWDDLQISNTGNYGIFTWNDTTNHLYVIEWSHATNRNTSSIETFEMVIYDPAYYPTVTGDAEFLYQYNVVNNNDSGESYASVGFENWEQNTGVQYTYENSYSPGAATLANTMAIKITTNTGRGGVRGMVNLNNGGQNGGVVITALSGQHRTSSPTGDYWIKSVPLGMTSVTAQIDGYFPGKLDSINVISDQITDNVNFNLTVCPVPQHLIASDTLANRIEIRWDAVTHGDLSGYDLYRSRWQAGGFEKLNANPIAVNHYTDSSPTDSTVYWYYVTAVYSNIAWGTVESFNSNMDSGSLYNPTGINGDNLIPKEFFLSQNYPNPFNPTTTISYGLPRDSNVKIDIFNLLGQKVMTLVNDREKAGYKSLIWSGKDNAGQSVSSGVYFYRIDTGDRQLTKKMMLLK